MEKKMFLDGSLSKSELIDKVIELENKLEEKDVLLEEKDALINTLKEELEKQNGLIKRHSQNSNQPPSTDLYEKKPKPQSERQKSGKKTGGQPGHKGTTYSQVENPDIIEYYNPNECKNCAHDLSEVKVDRHIRQQEVEIPIIKPVVTEHRRASKTCPSCKTVTTAEGPSHITQPIQYGRRFQALATYLVYEQFVPLKRVQDLFYDVFSLKISQGSLIAMHEKMSTSLTKTVYKDLYEEILNSDVVNFDETGMRVKKKTYWLHSASTPRATICLIHPKRGQEAMNALNILPSYLGIAVHDHWFPYFTYLNAQHALCNEHHRRELRGMYENYHQAWAQDMRSLLGTILESVKEYKNAGKKELPEDMLTNYSEKYDSILEKACSEIPKLNQPTGPKKRGKVKRHPADNLRNRLVTYKTETLRFMHNFAVPFTNNQAERDVRMAKVKQKISGCFRSPEGANRFCTIRSYISTAKKRGISVFAALENAARGQPETFSS